MLDSLKIYTNVEIEKINVETGVVREVTKAHNLVTLVGLNQIRNSLAGDSITFPTHLAIGTSATAATIANTTLGAEVFRDTLTAKNKISNGVMQYKYYLSSTDGNGSTYAEAGLLNASSAGDMLARVTHTADAKTSAEAWTYTWTVTIANS